jgi:hypothetical protein
MKKAFTLLTIMLFCGITFGNPISENTAKNIGLSFLAGKANASNLKSMVNLQTIYIAKSNKSAASIQPTNFYYVFGTGKNGFIIVAGDDQVTPILGYSDKNNFDPENMPQNVAKWMEGYKKEIKYVVEKNIPANKIISEQWQSLQSGLNYSSNTKTAAGVNPLLLTQWNQSPYYNQLCPGGSVTGCVATAMAQIMKYWNYPATGSGFHSYNHQTYGTLSANFGTTSYEWGSMPNNVNSANSAVATLMYQVGVSVDMDYSPEVSGAYVISDQSPVTHCSEYALKTYFGYKNTLQGVQRTNYTQTAWVNLIKSELDANRPVLYAGFGTGGGHCFVADGYDNNDYIHFNWGWGGAYDGYFQINALNPDGTGTGGGDGGYNSGHQAVIGIEPPVITQTNNLALYNYVTPSSTTIQYGDAFSVTTNIENIGTGTFNGDYTMAVFDNAYNFIDYIQTYTGKSLQAGYHYTDNIVFSTQELYSMLPGTYYVGLFYRPTGGNWIIVSDQNGYTNMVQMTVVFSNDIELYSDITTTPENTFVQGQPVTVSLNVINNGAGTFTGKIGAGLYTLDGSLSETIDIYDETTGLPSGFVYNENLSLSSSSITSEPGTYLLAVQYNPNNTGWQLTGSTDYQNPVKIIIVATTLEPDIYEDNNSVVQSYGLPISFVGNSASVNTEGSNCDVTSDNDFYKVVLPFGESYLVTPRIHDSYNSGDGNVYSLDGIFSYSTDGVYWSDVFDDVMPGGIYLNNGGTVYFHIAPYFAGEKGTYLLDIELARNVPTSITENNMEDFINVFPNPAKDFVTIDLKNINDKINLVNLLNSQGQSVYSENINKVANTWNVPLQELPDGIYFLQIQTNNGIVARKIIVGK